MRGGFGTDIVATIGEITFGSSYPVGGESLAASDVGLSDILFILFSCEPSAGAGGGQGIAAVQYNYDNSKLMVITASASTAGNLAAKEVANGSNLSAYTVRFIAFGHKLS
jgi:hypothetical protein